MSVLTFVKKKKSIISQIVALCCSHSSISSPIGSIHELPALLPIVCDLLTICTILYCINGKVFPSFHE